MAVGLVIFGRQGAGKGTQCDFIVERYGAVHISTGDMLRDAVADGTPLGAKAQEYMDRGDLLPDDLIVSIVRDRLAKPDVTENGYLLDGFPRTLAQAEALWDAAADNIDVAINIDVPLDEVMKRMMGRGREDDTEEAIARRLENYEQQTVPAIDFFEQKATLVVVDGFGSPDEVADRMFAAIDAVL